MRADTKYAMLAAVVVVGSVGRAGVARADGRFSALTYNVAGLLEPFSGGDPSVNTPIISCKIRGYTLVNVQEDFNYHAALYDACDDHPYRSPTSGGMAIGSGLNTLSYLPYADFERVAWQHCHGVDCLTPKGFTHARVRLEEGGYLSLYNLHAQAQTEDLDLAARRQNVLQLLAYIERNSAGDAIVVMGDTNTRYTRSGDNVREFVRHGFRDVWVERRRGGVLPVQGAAALTSCADLASADCEIVDKVFYRESAHLTLTPEDYQVDRTRFVDGAGGPLSDHFPVIADFAHGTTGRFVLSDQVGGPHGEAFHDGALLPLAPSLERLVMRSGARVDSIEAVLSNGYVTRHGGGGGSESSLSLAGDETLDSLQVCVGQKSGLTRIFRMVATTSRGRVLAGGTATRQCTTFRAPRGHGIVGFHGRSGDELDKLGVVYAPVQSVRSGRADYVQIVNVRSGLCMDVAGANVRAGSDVQQWTCNGGDWQKWNHDTVTGLVHSKQDPGYCLDNTGYYGDGADLRVELCTGSANQRFDVDAAGGTLRMRTAPEQVIDGVGTAPGDAIITWSDWGGDNQRWRFIP